MQQSSCANDMWNYIMHSSWNRNNAAKKTKKVLCEKMHEFKQNQSGVWVGGSR